MSFAPWIKIETTLPDKPEVIAIAARLRMKDPDAVTGKLVRLWAWADQNSIDGHDLLITREFIDRLADKRGFAAALEAVGWLNGHDGALSFPRFDRHNGESAKKRANDARRQQRKRGRDESHADSVTNVTPPTRTSVTPSTGKKTDQEIEVEGEVEFTTTTAREAESLIAAYARPSLDRPALEAAADTLRRFRGQFTFAQILAAVQAVTAAVRDWPEDERLTYLPTAANFFQKDLWRRHPADWESRRAAKVRTAATNGKPPLANGSVDIGGRRIAGVLNTTAALPATDRADPFADDQTPTF